MKINNYIIAIVGPTASGKSDLAQEIALIRKGIVLSADALQIYKGLDIGTAKLPKEERKVPHFGIDIVEPTNTYSAAQYQEYARGVIEQAFSLKQQVVLAGGTGLYVRAALDDMRFAPGCQEDNVVRKKYEKIAQEQGPDFLYELLIKRDPAAADAVHKNNIKRVIRALEIVESGELYSTRVEHFKDRSSYYPTLYIGLEPSRDRLYDAINARVETMIQRGLVDEVEHLLRQGLLTSVTSSQAIGYKELTEVVEGGASLALAVETIQQNSRRYAKRQLSWFHGDPRVHWISTDNLTPQQVLAQALDLIAHYESEQQ